jgi:hypothetical protein
MMEETGVDGVQCGSVESGDEEIAGGDIRVLGWKPNDTRRATIYMLKNIRSGFKLEPLLIVLKTYPHRSSLKPLLMKVLPAAVQN